MTPEFSLVALFDLLAFVQGTLLGVLLMSKKKNHISYFLLGLFLFSYSSELIVSVLHDSRIYGHRPDLLYLPVSFYFLFMPCLLLYVKSLSEEILWKKYIWMFLPALIEFGMMITLFIQPAQVKMIQFENGEVSSFYNLYVNIAMIYSIIYGVVILRQIQIHSDKISSFYSNLQGKQLRWVRWICVFIILINIVLLSSVFSGQGLFRESVYPIISVLNVIFVFWAALSGYNQRTSFFIDDNIDSDSKAEVKKEVKERESKTDDFDENKYSEKEYQNILKVIKAEKLFIDSDLHLADLAKQLNISQRYLSDLINQMGGVNFNQFINKFRIEEAKQMLLDEKFVHLNIMGIGNEVGINSKSTFYTAFKNEVGITPSKYQKQELVNV